MDTGIEQGSRCQDRLTHRFIVSDRLSEMEGFHNCLVTSSVVLSSDARLLNKVCQSLGLLEGS